MRRVRLKFISDHPVQHYPSESYRGVSVWRLNGESLSAVLRQPKLCRGVRGPYLLDKWGDIDRTLFEGDRR